MKAKPIVYSCAFLCREATIQAMNHVKATVTNFDKRHLNTKFYVSDVHCTAVSTYSGIVNVALI